MDRFHRCLLIWAGVLALLQAGEAKPNVLIIIADDLAWHDVACFGGPTDARTPHLDALAAQGMRLTRFYSPAAVCSPTRQALLTGLYPVRSGAYPNHAMVRDGVRSLPHHLKALGYRTGCFGKTHFAPAKSYPFDVLTGFASKGDKKAGGKNKADKPADGEDAKEGDEKAGGEKEDGEIDLTKVSSFFEKRDQPFCAYFAPHEPHGPWTVGDRSPYNAAKLKLPPHLIDTPETRAALVAYYAEVTHLDRTVGAVMAALERSGQAANTLVLFVSEQGSGVPHGKWTLYDAGIRIAAIARWPGKIAADSTNAALVQYVDVLPTLIAAAGGDPSTIDPGCPDALGGKTIDGRSFLDVLLGKTTSHREVAFAQHTTNGIINGSKAYASRAVCDGRWKLIWNLHATEAFTNTISDGAILKSWRTKGESGDAFAAEQAARYGRRPEWELYDLQTDPWELTNVAAKPEHAETVSALRNKLDAWMQQQGDQGDRTEREAQKHQPGRK